MRTTHLIADEDVLPSLCYYDRDRSATILDVDGSVLKNSFHDHPWVGAKTASRGLRTKVIAESDNKLLRSMPISPETGDIVTVADKRGRTYLRVMYVRKSEELCDLVDDCVIKTLDAVDLKATRRDSKAGGSYIIGGWGCQTKSATQARVQAPATAKTINVPYFKTTQNIRDSTVVDRAMSTVSKLMGRVAELLGAAFPEVMHESALKARRRLVTGSFFSVPYPCSAALWPPQCQRRQWLDCKPPGCHSSVWQDHSSLAAE